jgi:endonuclease/exonuclease/phosphatase (EEP) superfamily protein YafD
MSASSPDWLSTSTKSAQSERAARTRPQDNSDLKQMLKQLEAMMESSCDKYQSVIMAGDFNVDLHSTLRSSFYKKRALQSFMDRHDLP